MEKEPLDALMELDGDTGGSLIIDMIASYRLEMPKRLARFKTQLAARDAGALMFEAHAMKSSFANFGALKVADIFHRIESAAKTSDWKTIDSAVTEMPAGMGLFEDDILELEKIVTDPKRKKVS